MRESGRPGHLERCQRVITPSTFTCLPNPSPYARIPSAFWRLSIMPAGWQRVATRYPAGSLLPGECGRYTSSPHSNLPESSWSNLQIAPRSGKPPSRCSPARLPCRPLGSQGSMQPWAPDSYRRLAAVSCRAAHYAQECIRILWHRLEQPVNPAWCVGSTANAANTSSASW
jgi:hypothetical protein